MAARRGAPSCRSHGFRRLQQAKGRACQRGERRRDRPRRRADAGAQRAQHFDQPGRAGRGDEMAQVGFERPDRQVSCTVENARRAFDLGCIAHRRPRGMTFEQRDVAGRQPGHGIGCLPSRASGPRRQATRKPPALPSLDSPMPRITPRISSPAATASSSRLSTTKAAPSAGHQAVGVGGKGTALAAPAHGLQRAEADVDKEIVGAVDRAGDHHIGAPILEPVAGQFDRVERGGTGRVEGKGIAAEIQRLGRQVRRQARREAVARILYTPASGGRGTSSAWAANQVDSANCTRPAVG